MYSTLTLAVALRVPINGPEPRPLVWGGKGAMNRKPLRVLLADSDPANRRALERHLEGTAFSVGTTACGADAILWCEIDPPDILILDVHLTDMDGFEVCEYVRHETREHDLTIIITTEVSDEMTRAYLGQMVEYAGGDYFMAKPCDDKVLLTLLETLTPEAGPPVPRTGRSPTVGRSSRIGC